MRYMGNKQLQAGLPSNVHIIHLERVGTRMSDTQVWVSRARQRYWRPWSQGGDQYQDLFYTSLNVKSETIKFETVNLEFDRALKLDRADLLKPKCYPHSGALTPLGAGRPRFKPSFILTYHPCGPNLTKWLREAFLILCSDKKLKEIYPTPPSVLHRQPLQPEADTSSLCPQGASIQRLQWQGGEGHPRMLQCLFSDDCTLVIFVYETLSKKLH
jgi:hypothetical protein